MVETCKWISNASPSRVRPSAATSQTFFPSFLPSCNRVTIPLNPQQPSTPPCLEEKIFPNRRRPRTQGQVTSRHVVRGGGPGYGSSSVILCTTSRHINRHMDHAPVWVCVCVCVWGSQQQIHTHSQPATSPLPLSLPKSAFSPCQWGEPLPHPASSEPQQQQQHLCHRHREGAAMEQPGLSCIPVEHRDSFVPVSPLSLPQTGFSWFWTPNIKQHGLEKTHRKKQCAHLPGSTATLLGYAAHITSWRFC